MRSLGVDVPSNGDSQIFNYLHVNEGSAADLLPQDAGRPWSNELNAFHSEVLDIFKRWLA